MKGDGKIVGMDFSQGMLGCACTRLKQCVRGDSELLPFKERSFDIIFARSLLHHLPNPEKGIVEMARVLKNGGRFVIADTHKSIISLLPRKIAKKGKHFSDAHKNLSLDELLAQLKDNFGIESVCYFGYIAYPLLGFPDLVDFFKYLPFKITVAKWLIRLDEWISKIPLVNRLSWGIMIAGKKR
jgi:ubiquinone/menaquinone biosynthesis C-methylase UbiE